MNRGVLTAERRRLLLKALEREGAATLRALAEAMGADLARVA